MPGAPRGPVPKRSDQRRRRNAESKPDIVTLPAAAPGTTTTESVVEAPPAEESWHALAKGYYESLVQSGQAQFYEPSDWAFARVHFSLWSRVLDDLDNGEKLNANLIAALEAGDQRLLITEADRRRARLEVKRETEEAPPSVAIMAKYRSGTGA